MDKALEAQEGAAFLPQVSSAGQASCLVPQSHLSAVVRTEGFEGLRLGLRPPEKVHSQMGRLAMEEE